MKYGAAIFPTDYAIRPDEVAREAEQRDLRRQELQTLLTIVDELRRVREVLEAQ